VQPKIPNINESLEIYDENKDEDRLGVIKRIKSLEDGQKLTSEQIKRLNQARTEVLRLKQLVEQSAATANQARKGYEKNQQSKIAKLNEQIHNREVECKNLKKKFEAMSQYTQENTELLKEQLQVAMAMQKSMETEKETLSFKCENNFRKGLLIGLMFSILTIAVLAGTFLNTSLFDNLICQMKQPTISCSFQ
jgi:archaellum component FlaC